MKVFKNCNVIYFKNREIFESIIPHVSLKGKIIISDFPEINKLCYVYGLTHILNLNKNMIPGEKFDCIVLGNTRNNTLESDIINKGIYSPIIYIIPGNEKQQIWCGTCNKTYITENPVNKFCSEKCMNTAGGFIGEDIGLSRMMSDKKPLIEFDRVASEKISSSAKKAVDKFQNSVVKDAIRLEYAFKRESYKKEMKQPSFRKTNKINRSTSDSVKICRGTTKKGTRCTNKVIGSSHYCGILSHSMEVGSVTKDESVVSMGEI